MAQVGEARPGYELWRPNREKAEAKTTKAIIALVLLVSAALLAIITLGGWERLQSPGVGVATMLWAGLYVVFALLALNWTRGILPVAASLAVIMIIFAAVAAPGWFARAKDGLDSPILPEDLLGLLTVIVIPVQLLLIAVAMVGFSQEWHVEEERPVDGEEPDDEPPRDDYADEDTGPTGEDGYGEHAEGEEEQYAEEAPEEEASGEDPYAEQEPAEGDTYAEDGSPEDEGSEPSPEDEHAADEQGWLPPDQRGSES